MLAIILISLVLVSFVLTYLVRHFAIKKAILDIPNDRSSHTIPTPRGGGLAVVATWFIGITIAFYLGYIEKNFFFALLSGAPLVVIGFLDDIYNLKAELRFLVHILVAAFALQFLDGFSYLNILHFRIEAQTFLTVLSFIGIVWSINLFNFLDGIDGYLGLETVFVGVACYAITNNVIGLLLAASTIGFLFWNWQKAKIFMGDVGSTLIGFTVAVIAIYQQNTHELSIWIWLILTSLFWFDATFTLFRRLLNKERISEAHRKHAYQRIVQAGFSHQKTTLFALAINCMLFAVSWIAYYYTNKILFLIGTVIVLYFIVKWIDTKKAFNS